MPKSVPKVPESGVLRACLDLLAAEKVWHRRWNTGAVKIGMNPNQQARFFRFGQKGDADILASVFVPQQAPAVRPIFLWIECKSDSGCQTQDQQKFEREVSEEGHRYLLVRDVDTLRDWLKAHGATR